MVKGATTLPDSREILRALVEGESTPSSLGRLSAALDVPKERLLRELRHLSALDLVDRHEGKWDVTYQGRRAIRAGEPIPSPMPKATTADRIVELLGKTSPMTVPAMVQVLGLPGGSVQHAAGQLFRSGKLTRDGRQPYAYSLAPADAKAETEADPPVALDPSRATLAVLATLPDGGSSRQVADLLGISRPCARNRLIRLVRDGLVRVEDTSPISYHLVSPEPSSPPPVEALPESAAPAPGDTPTSPPASVASGPSSRAGETTDAGGPSPSSGATPTPTAVASEDLAIEGRADPVVVVPQDADGDGAGTETATAPEPEPTPTPEPVAAPSEARTATTIRDELEAQAGELVGDWLVGLRPEALEQISGHDVEALIRGIADHLEGL